MSANTSYQKGLRGALAALLAVSLATGTFPLHAIAETTNPTRGAAAATGAEVAETSAESSGSEATASASPSDAVSHKPEEQAKGERQNACLAASTPCEDEGLSLATQSEQVQTVSGWGDVRRAVLDAQEGDVLTFHLQSGESTAGNPIVIKRNMTVAIDAAQGSAHVVTKGEYCGGALFTVEEGATLVLGGGMTYKGRASHMDHAISSADGASGGLFAYSRGTLKIAGATIEDFVSEYCTAGGNDKSYCNLARGNNSNAVRNRLSPYDGSNAGTYLRYSAPIYIESTGSLEMTSGEIRNNRVGYSLSDGEEEFLSNVGYGMLHDVLYNADSGFEGRSTGSAGAITLAGGSSAVISGGVISGNKGDAGAIHVRAGARLEMPAGDTEIDRDLIKNQHPDLLNNPHWEDFVNMAGEGLEPTGALVMDNTGLTMGTVCVRSNEDLMGMTARGTTYVRDERHFDRSDTPSEFLMKGGLIFDNINWFRGAVSVSGDAKLLLDSDKTLEDEGTYPIVATNLSREKGGGIYVHSNGADLVKGWVIDNKSWAMGGGIYVEAPYALRIADAAVYKNDATFSDRFATQALEREYEPQSEADRRAFGNTYPEYGGTPHTNDCSFGSGRTQFFPGSGGGIWLCPTGSMYFDATAAYLGGNGAEKQGDDFFKDTGAAYWGSAGGTLIRFDDNYHSWVFDRDPNQEDGTRFDSDTHSMLAEQSVLSLRNETPEQTLAQVNSHEGMHVAFNTSRRGGGIGCNGYVSFSNSPDGESEYSFSADLELEKTWRDVPEDRRENHLHFKAFYLLNGEKVELKDFMLGDKDAEIGGEAGDATTVGEYQDMVNAQGDDGITLDGWKARLTLPTSIFGTKLFDPEEVRVGFEEARAKGETYSIDADQAKIVFEEYDHEWQEPVQTYVCEPSDVVVTGFDRTTETITVSPYSKPIDVTMTNDAFSFETRLSNHYDEPAIEKYVEKDTHAALPAFDSTYTYDVLAWVTRDAQRITIVDSLVPALEFAKGADTAVTVAVKDANNHEVHGTVENEPARTLAEGEYSVSFADTTGDGSPDTLTVEIPDAVGSRLQGKWVQASFAAKIKDEYASLVDAAVVDGGTSSYRVLGRLRDAGLGWGTVSDDGPVLEGAVPHVGLTNSARYKITPTNAARSYPEKESNTVTVEPPTEDVSVTKEWRDASGAELSWPRGVRVTVAVLGADDAVVGMADLDADSPSHTFAGLPTLEGVGYRVVETAVTGMSGEYASTVSDPVVSPAADGVSKVTAYSITNRPTTKVRLEATKTLEGRVLRDGEFGFELLDADGAVLQTKTNDANGIVLFDDISYDRLGSFEYKVREMPSSDGGVSADDVVYDVTVDVTQDDDGLFAEVMYARDGRQVDGLAFDNVVENVPTYAPVVVDVWGTKTLRGGEMSAGQFAFRLNDAHGDVIQTMVNDEDGFIAFDPIEFTREGTYAFEVVEVDGNAPGEEDDPAVHVVTVRVTADAKGELVADQVVTRNGSPVDVLAYENLIEGAPVYPSVEVAPMARKTLLGRVLRGGEFSFVLDDAHGEVAQAKGNGADGAVRFDSLSFDQVGTYAFVMREARGTDATVTYDGRAYVMTVEVRQGDDGRLTASARYAQDGKDVGEALFENTCVPGEPGRSIATSVARLATPRTGDPVPPAVPLLPLGILAFVAAGLARRRQDG